MLMNIINNESKESVMTKKQLQKKIAQLEFVHDQLDAELSYVNDLLMSVGFPKGLESAKEVALELLAEAEQESHQENENS